MQMPKVIVLMACANPACRLPKKHGLKTCKQCGNVKYCDRDCQRADWPNHKPACQRAASLQAEDPKKIVTADHRTQIQEWYANFRNCMTTFWASWMYEHREDQERMVIEAHHLDMAEEDVTVMRRISLDKYIAEDEKVRGHERQIIEQGPRHRTISLHYLHWKEFSTADKKDPVVTPMGFFTQLQTSPTLLERTARMFEESNPLAARTVNGLFK